MKLFANRLKIRTKLILLMILIAYLSVVTVGVLCYMVGKRIIDTQINQTLNLQTQTTLESINKLVYDRFNDLQLLIGESTLSSSEATSEEKTQILRNSLVNLGWYDELYLTDQNGKVIASTLKTAIGSIVSDLSWYESTERDFVYVSDVIESSFTGKESLVFTNTVQDQAKNVLGILSAEFPLNIITDLLKRLPQETEAYLIASDSRILAYKGPEPLNNPSISESGYYLHADTHLRQEIVSDGYFSFDGNDWRLALQIPKDLAYAPINRFAFLLILILAAISVPVVIFGHFSSKRFVSPILALAEVMGKVRRGNLKQEIKVNSNDEIGYLANSFNKMTKELLEKTNNLSEERGKYKSILESTNEGIVLFDTSDRLIAYNHGFENIFTKGKRLKEGSAVKEVLSFLSKEKVSDESGKNLQKIQKIINERDFEKSVNVEIILKKPDHRILYLYTKPVLTEKNQLLGRIWVFKDVTKELESERSKTEFVKVASHKLRTPVTSLNWNTQMLLDGSLGALSKEQEEVIKELKNNAERLGYLSTILMNTAEIENGKLGLKKDIFYLKDLFKKVKRGLQSHLQNRPLASLTMNEEACGEIKVKGDQEKLAQVLHSILDNAFIYEKEGIKNLVKVKTKLMKKEKKILISVSDQGIGLGKSDQDKVFTKFFRTKKAYLIHTEGTGLSLFLAKIIQLSHQEKIWLESKETKGTTFYFTIKLAD